MDPLKHCYLLTHGGERGTGSASFGALLRQHLQENTKLFGTHLEAMDLVLEGAHRPHSSAESLKCVGGDGMRDWSDRSQQNHAADDGDHVDDNRQEQASPIARM